LTQRKYSHKQATRQLRRWLDSKYEYKTTAYDSYGDKGDGVECVIIPADRFRAVVEALEATIPRDSRTEK
jgi:hypothetical protein